MKLLMKFKVIIIIGLIAVVGTTTWFYYYSKSSNKTPERARLVLEEYEDENTYLS